MLLPTYDELVSLSKQKKPKHEPLRSKAKSDVFGGHTSLFKGRGLDFSEFREYASGDDIRSIDWKVTARVGRAHTKLFNEERERSIYVILDLNSYMEFGTRGTFKSVQAARAAAFIAWRSHQLHDKVGAILFGCGQERIQILSAKRSRKSIWEMIRILSSPKAKKNEVQIVEALSTSNKRIPSGSTIFIISDFFDLSSGFESQLGVLARRCDVKLIKITDPVDKEIPDSATIQFSDEKGFNLTVDTTNSKGKNTYRKIWKMNDDSLVQIAHRFGIKILRLSTDGDVRTDLFSHSHQPKRKML